MKQISNMKQQAGFTLIELVIVIVILGIMAATALPKFVDLTSEAEQAATDAVAAAVSSAGNANYAKYKASAGTSGYAISDTTDACAGAANSVFANKTNLVQGSVSLVDSATGQTTSQYLIAGGATKVCAAGTVIDCSITHKNGKTQKAYVPCTN